MINPNIGIKRKLCYFLVFEEIREAIMLLKQALEDKLMDYRVRDRLLEEGKITKEELEKFMKDLPNDEDKLQESKID